MNRNSVQYFTIKELLGSDDQYVIPIYQRPYAWTNKEITQLIQDIVDYQRKDKDQKYYIGTLVANEHRTQGLNEFDVIDGQQRFTTLTILLCVIKNEMKTDISWYKRPNLRFQSRKNSSDTIRCLFYKENLDRNHTTDSIVTGCQDAIMALKRILNDSGVSEEDFCDYLFNKVNVLRVLVPEDTDMNHYFEIMNTRGVQLEKHEILKAELLHALNDHEKCVFNKIWEGCSNMEKYIQYGFTANERRQIFENDWNTDIEALYSYKSEGNCSDDSQSQTLQEIISDQTMTVKEGNTEQDTYSQRFNSVVNFPNFLLHILRIQTGQDIPLDDKRLLELFNSQKEEGQKDFNPDFVKTFGYNLLKGKLLYDKYIIKREFLNGADKWSLKQLVRSDSDTYYKNTFGDEDSEDGINREIIMLLSMFHVSTPTQVYKHWLYGVLKWLFEQEKSVEADKYRAYLKELADAFLYDRFLAKRPKEYFDIIYNNHGHNQNRKDAIEITKLDNGTFVENFVFNYLDYLLWVEYKKTDNDYFVVEERRISDERIAKFEFTFRSSVEHYYPQHPIDEKLSIDKEWLDNFGNLCLISGEKNSRLSNYMPQAKKDHYNNSDTIDSIKQRIMMAYEEWDTKGANNINEIEIHGNHMKQLLMNRITD